MSRAHPTGHEVLLERAGFTPRRPRAPVTSFRVCGSCRSHEDPLSCQEMASCPTRTVSLKRVEATSAMLVAHAFPWCRARLLHALGAAEEQGVLRDVLAEILGDDAEVEHVRKHLRRHGWAS